ncbi:hypothetical protein TRFO_11718 [Tritrichomonas foetus]|uniref:Tyr recombinase domain-containing protein n=1 Tax=Tritrichomonas foetus TaxID=1144522 RepID=A0A1J4J8F4_9EUKA|nr:hypothetical protein TRFO_11718 [Tritrichomonas foetus]|eukprot:OHS93516.1 hypothetical protein TRFO_11718 [Tritrichomonas foetus]
MRENIILKLVNFSRSLFQYPFKIKFNPVYGNCFFGLLFSQTTKKSEIPKKRCLGNRSSSLYSFRYDPKSRSAGSPIQPQFSCSIFKTYEEGLNQYKNFMLQTAQLDPFPITVDYMIAFIVYQKNLGRTLNTLLNYGRAFSFHFRDQNLPNLTLHTQFKTFISGLRHTMGAHNIPYQKHPFQREWFRLMLQKFPVVASDNMTFMLISTLSWSCLLRISELRILRKCDLQYDPNERRLSVFIRWSKSDQTGNGETCFVPHSDSESNPIHYLKALDSLSDQDLICPLSQGALRSHLRTVLRAIGVDNPECYSFHSFRRGAAFLASAVGVDDCVIKKFGRWRSDAYIRYVSVDIHRASAEVGNAIS